MARIEFPELVQLYRHAKFGAGGGDDESLVSVANKAIADLLARVEKDDYAAAETGVTLLDDLAKVEVGATVKARLDDPRSGFAVLAHDADGLIRSPRGRMDEPARFYLVDPPYAPGDPVVPDAVLRYRKVLAVVKLFGQAASLVDATKSELVFVRDGKTVLPVRFDAADLPNLDMVAADRLLSLFADELHRDQKCSILFEAMVDLCRAHNAQSRFRFALRSLDDLADKVAAGYRLFASSFSYSKIRSELEDARIDYTQKIHQTIVDIQNQLLGIPVATIVVASQMKAPTICGPELWVNVAVLIGAWIFVLMLLVAIVNQWMTLNVIGDEIDQQRIALQRDFALVSADLVGTFSKLKRRIRVHKVGLCIVLAIGITGGVTATRFESRIAALPAQPCPAPAKLGPAATEAGNSTVPEGANEVDPREAAEANGMAASPPNANAAAGNEVGR